MKRVSLVLGIALAILVAVVVVRAARMTSRQLPVEPLPERQIDTRAVERFAAALRFATVSHQDPALDDKAAFASLREFLKESFPRVHRELAGELIVERTLFFRWPGDGDPILLMAHQDVVPVENERAWSHPPFSGAIADGFVWGRGALDDKGNLMAMLEAAESLLAEGFRPKRTVLFAFGHDEEVGGSGNQALAKLLVERGVKLEAVLDEGTPVSLGIIDGLAAPLATVAIAEKGYLTLELSAAGEGGHSSMPPSQTASGIIAAAVARLEAQPFPAELGAHVHGLLDELAPEMPFSRRLALANLWLFAPILKAQMLKKPATAASLRTTQAATMLEGSAKENVLPTRARALVNLRILPGQSIASATARVREVIADARVTVAETGRLHGEPVPPSSTRARAYGELTRTIRQLFPGAIAAPTLMLGTTDSRHYRELARDLYRFSPFIMRSHDIPRLHGINERLSVDGYLRAVRFYAQLLRQLAS